MNLKTSRFVKIASLVAGILVAVSVLAPVSSVQAQSVADLQAMIGQLQLQLNQLQAGGSGSAMVSCTFTRNLTTGATGADVKCLQQYLNGKGFTVSTSGAGSPGQETMTFGSRTKAALARYQAANGISPAVGYFGPITRAQVNSMMATVPTTPTPTPVPPGVAGSVTISAAAQPANSLAPTSASRVPFTKFTLTAGASDVTISGIVVERTGLAQDAVFAGVVLLDENGLQIGVARTLGSTHQATIGETMTIRAGQSRTFTVAGNMASSLTAYAGQVASLSVIGVTTPATVSGQLPITGANHTINASLTLGSITTGISTFDPNTAITKEVGTANYNIAGVRATAGSAEDIRLWSVRWNQSGSAGSGDLANVKVYVDGTAYDTVISSDGKYYTALFGSGIKIEKGLAKDIYVKLDIVGPGSASRTAQFDLYKTTDIYFTGETYGYGITPSATAGCATAATTASEFIYSAASCGGTASTPWFSGSTVTIAAGSATSITKANSIQAQNIAVNLPNQVLGGYTTDIKGEPISVQSSVFTVASTTGSGYGLLTNVSIYDETGRVVAGPIDAAYTSALVQTLTFTDTITYPTGLRTYTIKGKVASTIGNGGTYVVSTTPSSGWTNVTGQITGNSISLSTNGAFSMNTMTVRAAALAVTVSTDPVAQNVVGGGQQRTFSNVQFDASQSGEDVRFSSVPMTMTYGSNSTATDLNTCQLLDGATALNTTTVVNLSATTSVGATTHTFTLDQAFTVPKGVVKTLTVKCNVSSSATAGNSYAWGMTSTQIGAISVTGVTSSNTVTATGATFVGPVMTLAAGSLVASTDSSSPSYTVAAAGSTGVPAAVYRFRATNEAINLQRIGLNLTNTATSAARDLVRVTIWDGGTQVGSAVFTGTSLRATSTGMNGNADLNVTVPKNTDKVLTIKADLAAIGSSQPGIDGHLIAIDIDTNGSGSTANTKGTGLDSGTAIASTGSTAVAGIRMFKTYPTFAAETLPASGVADGRLLRFRVTANNAGDVGIEHFTVTLATSSATVTGVNLYGFTDSAFSQPVSGVNNGGQFMTTNRCASGCQSNAPALVFYAQTTAAASTTVQVPAGQSRYFEVRGTVTGLATTYSITTTLNGDSAFPAVGACNTDENTPCTQPAKTVGSGSNASFVWATNATTTATVTDNNWTNAYGLQGLPASGIIQTRSN